MRRPFQFEGLTQFAPPFDPRDGAAVVEPKQLLENQQGEQLGLGELVRALGV
jgi:hypothetical protein